MTFLKRLNRLRKLAARIMKLSHAKKRGGAAMILGPLRQEASIATAGFVECAALCKKLGGFPTELRAPRLIENIPVGQLVEVTCRGRKQPSRTL